MIAIPAIDLKSGKVVRLRQGNTENSTVYSDDPVQMAQLWERKGAKLLHVVDLDGAFSGKSVHTKIIREIARTLMIPVELGGGLRSLEAIDAALNFGIDRVVLGSAAVSEPRIVEEALRRFSPEKIILGVDARDGKIATHGWQKLTETSLFDFLRHWETLGIRHVIYTDISRDGMLTGPNAEAVLQLAENFSFQIIVSGGIATEADVLQFCRSELTTIEGVILGKALYTKAIDFEHLIRKMEQRQC